MIKIEIAIELYGIRGKELIYGSIKNSNLKSIRDAVIVKGVTNLRSEQTSIVIITDTESVRIPRDWIYKFEMRNKFDV